MDSEKMKQAIAERKRLANMKWQQMKQRVENTNARALELAD